jgi:hypothetical protein
MQLVEATNESRDRGRADTTTTRESAARAQTGSVVAMCPSLDELAPRPKGIRELEQA